MTTRKAKSKQNKRGQAIGNKGDRSRQRIVDAAFELLKIKRVWEVSVTNICTICHIAPSNLYTYFGDVNDVVLELARQVGAGYPPVANMLAEAGGDGLTLKQCRRIVDAVFGYWDRFRPVLKVVELMADEGDAAFNDIRAQRLLPMYAAIRPLIVRAQRSGRLHRRLSPNVVAISIMGLIESAAMHVPLIVAFGDSFESLAETQARLLFSHLGGSDQA